MSLHPIFKELGLDAAQGDKFAPLCRYFSTLTLTDLAQFDSEDLADAAEPQDRLLMRVFANLVVKWSNYKHPCSDVLSLNIISWKFENLDSGKISVKRLSSLLPTESRHYDVINLSNVPLFDVDMLFINEAFKETLIRATLLDLSNNLFGQDKTNDTYHTVRELARNERFQYIDVSETPLCEDIHAEFWKSCTKNELEKLIWLSPFVVNDPERWVNYAQADAIAIIAETHSRFYATRLKKDRY